MKNTNLTDRIVCAAAALVIGAAAWTVWESTTEAPHAVPTPPKTALAPRVARMTHTQTLRAERSTGSALPPAEDSPLFIELFHTGDEKVRDLTQRILSGKDATGRAAAADALATHGTFDAVNNLVNLAIMERHPATRRALLESFQNIATKDGLLALASVVTVTRESEVLAAAISSLSRSGDAEIIDALVDFYRERNDGPYQKAAALRAIAAIRNPQSARPLAKLAAHAPEPALVDAANSALAAVGRAQPVPEQ